MSVPCKPEFVGTSSKASLENRQRGWSRPRPQIVPSPSSAQIVRELKPGGRNVCHCASVERRRSNSPACRRKVIAFERDEIIVVVASDEPSPFHSNWNAPSRKVLREPS